MRPNYLLSLLMLFAFVPSQADDAKVAQADGSTVTQADGSTVTQADDSKVTVVELFTSQGCHSCPRADSFLGELKEQQDVIALSCHVTYWNYLGWEDTFSNTFCDNRQRAYQSELAGNAGVYTPQMVINGEYGGVGSQKRRVHQFINASNASSSVEAIQLTLTGDNSLNIELPELAAGKQKLLLLGTLGDHELLISRGENRGKTLTYHNPVSEFVDLGTWDGSSKVLLESVASPDVKEWVVIAQSWPIGQITAAGKLTLN